MMQAASCDPLQTRTFFTGSATASPADSDYALARAAAGGALSAVGHLYERHRRRVYSLCYQMTRNVADAEDLTQEVFVHLFRKIGSFRGESLFTTWLHRLTVNQVLMHFRHSLAHNEKTGEDEDIEAELSHALRGKHSASPQDLERIAIERALARLPAGYRTVFVLYDIEGYSHDEIGSLLGCTAGTSKSQLHRARTRLRRLLTSRRLLRSYGAKRR